VTTVKKENSPRHEENGSQRAAKKGKEAGLDRFGKRAQPLRGKKKKNETNTYRKEQKVKGDRGGGEKTGLL